MADTIESVAEQIVENCLGIAGCGGSHHREECVKVIATILRSVKVEGDDALLLDALKLAEEHCTALGKQSFRECADRFRLRVLREREVREALRKGIAMVESSVSHVSHGGPTIKEAEAWLDAARKVLEGQNG